MDIILPVLYIVFIFGLYIGVPLFIVSMGKRKKQKEREETERWLKEQEEIKRQRQAAEAKRQEELQKQQREMMLQDIAEKYMNNPITLEIANELADFFVLNINQHDRKTTEPDINIRFFIVRKGQVIYADNESGCFALEFADYQYSLIEHHLKEIQDDVEFRGFLYAISLKAVEIIRGKLTKDPSGTFYNFEIKENIYKDYYGKYQYDGCGYDLIYTAKNGNYITPKEW